MSQEEKLSLLFSLFLNELEERSKYMGSVLKVTFL